ncbi:MAG: YjbQ family protein, partial [Deltaproteobacteria bacterium]
CFFATSVREVVVAVTGGKFDFGPWEQIFYGEFDGRRKKRVLVKIIGE